MQSATPSFPNDRPPPHTHPHHPIVSSQDRGWQHLLVEEFYQPPGEEICQSATSHVLCLSLNLRPSRLSLRMSDRSYTSLFRKGDLSIAPVQLLLFSQWSQDDRYLRIKIASEFLDHVAHRDMESNLNRVDLLPEFQVRNLQIEQISMMLLAELYSGGVAGHLYIESLTNLLAVHLLRNYSGHNPHIPVYQGGLSYQQLLKITDYISDRLADPIQLSDLSDLLGMSQFHFGRLFKQSMGVAPYQYVLQQRVERAKSLLQTTKLPIVEIALQCGFSSHSHLGKWLRHDTGMTPKAFRSQFS